MHWEWKNCPTGWQGSFSGKSRKSTIVLEAVADFDTWIWHAFFGIPGTQNDITVLGRSPLFDALTEGQSPQLDYHINNHRYNMGYYLANGIYPKWATLVQAIRRPQNEAEAYFTTKQEAFRKDVERAFGVLQNMIVEDERADYYNGESDDDESDPNRSRRARARILDEARENLERDPRSGRITMSEYMSRYRMIRSPVGNRHLQDDLVQHLWSLRGQAP
ncbi:uncharacterized protein LOC133730950 [Rosa rugosa]|uniref:uncharacterized protein LOC133730950 n=1 Tax=Rosa rugosa TaxID=74645 RepID=UPI002B404B55|nr:uncharacterized protein LOC133730950 [Rosa rugosa]